MTIGSLFSGIGGLELGLEQAGLGPVLFQVEKDPFARSVLSRHWPHALRFDDVRSVGAHNLPRVECLAGGFPCQDLSFAGAGAGIAGERSGLWREFARIAGELRPRFVVVENVAALLARGMGTVLGDLAALGYDAWWDCLPASAVGAPHRRDRLFIIAYAHGRDGAERRPGAGRQARDGLGSCGAGALADADRDGQQQPEGGVAEQWRRTRDGGEARTLADADGERGRQPEHEALPLAREDAREGPGGRGEPLGDADRPRLEERSRERGDAGAQLPTLERRATGAPEPGVGGATHGVPRWMDRGFPAGPGEAQHPWEALRTSAAAQDRSARLKALGNAVVPPVGEIIGRAILAFLESGEMA